MSKTNSSKKVAGSLYMQPADLGIKGKHSKLDKRAKAKRERVAGSPLKSSR